MCSSDLRYVSFRARVSGGTYLRSLARDVGEALGCGAHLAALTRTEVGPYRLAAAVAPEAVTRQDLRDPAELVADLPRRDLDEAGRAAVLHGRPVPRDSGLGPRGSGFEADVPSPESRAPSPVALFAAGQLVAVADRVGELLKPRVVVGEE